MRRTLNRSICQLPTNTNTKWQSRAGLSIKFLSTILRQRLSNKETKERLKWLAQLCVKKISTKNIEAKIEQQRNQRDFFWHSCVTVWLWSTAVCKETILCLRGRRSAVMKPRLILGVDNWKHRCCFNTFLLGSWIQYLIHWIYNPAKIPDT